MNYFVRKGKLLRPRKGIYVKPHYNPEELACTLYTPSYISLEYVLQKAGVIFQYDERITVVSYLSRSVDIEGRTYAYRKISDRGMLNGLGELMDEEMKNSENMNAYIRVDRKIA